MKRISKAIAITGVVAGLGVAALPLTSYAVTDSVTITVSVSDTISISASPSTVSLGTLTPNSATATGAGKKTVLTVHSNKASGYTVTASGADLTSGSYTIPYGTVTSGTSAYGASLSDNNYTALTAIGSKNTPSDAAGDTYTVYFGASTSATQATGEYSGAITFTAANK